MKRYTVTATHGKEEAELVIRVTGKECFVQDCAAYCQAEIARLKGSKGCGCKDDSRQEVQP